MLNIYLIHPNFNWRSQRFWILSPTNPAWREQGRGGESCLQSENCGKDVNARHDSVQVSARHLVRGDLASHQAGQTEVLPVFQMLQQFYHLPWVQSHGMILHSITWNDTFKWNKIVSMPIFLHFNCFPLASKVLFCNFVGIVASVHRSFHQPGRSLSPQLLQVSLAVSDRLVLINQKTQNLIQEKKAIFKTIGIHLASAGISDFANGSQPVGEAFHHLGYPLKCLCIFSKPRAWFGPSAHHL